MDCPHDDFAPMTLVDGDRGVECLDCHEAFRLELAYPWPNLDGLIELPEEACE